MSKIFNFNGQKEAFTLAEVLITLVIIGVIAALTVPSLIQNSNKEEMLSKFKKVHSTLQQATDMIMFEEGNAKGATGGWAKDVDSVYNQYKKHLNVAQDCGSEAGCMTQSTYKRLDGNADTIIVTSPNMRRMVLSDGTQLVFNFRNTTCTDNPSGTNNACAEIWADLNGAKLPNQYGRDAFLFVIKDNMLVPAGCDYADGYCKKGNGQILGGWGCACRVLSENAINY